MKNCFDEFKTRELTEVERVIKARKDGKHEKKKYLENTLNCFEVFYHKELA